MPCLNCEKVFEKGEPFCRLPDGLLKVCPECEAKAKATIERLDGVPFGSYSFRKPYLPDKKQSYQALMKRNYDRIRKLPGVVIIIRKGRQPKKIKTRQQLKEAARR